MAVPTGRESDKFMLRLPDGMRDRIKAVADHNGRSMNAEIVATLEKVYPPAQQVALINAVADIEAQLAIFDFHNASKQDLATMAQLRDALEMMKVAAGLSLPPRKR